MSERDAPAENDPQTGKGDVWGDEYVDVPGNEPGSQEPPAADDPSPA